MFSSISLGDSRLVGKGAWKMVQGKEGRTESRTKSRTENPTESTSGDDAETLRAPLPDEVRYCTLHLMEELLSSLVARYGARMTLGELLAITAGMARLCKQDRVTIAEIAEATGLPKQNLSRWARKRIGDSIYLEVDEDDQRKNELIMMDRNRAQEHIVMLAKLLGTDTR
jgi:hypothetical protein